MQAAQHIFELREQEEYADVTIVASFFEIYGGKLFDLLSDRYDMHIMCDRLLLQLTILGQMPLSDRRVLHPCPPAGTKHIRK
jgi:hypothetical protein